MKRTNYPKQQLPKQWKDWCRAARLKPTASGKIYWDGRRGGKDYWAYLIGQGYLWRVNCFDMFQRSCELEDFHRWANSLAVEAPIPKNKEEFLRVVKELIDKGDVE